MLQNLIKDLQSFLKNYSHGLVKQNLLVDIPWTIVDGDLNLQRLIFRKNNSLYIVKEGEINEGKWEYLTAMNSLVIEIAGKKILLNEVFADGKALILKRDGMTSEFLAFANQKELPDLDLAGYINSLKKSNISHSTTKDDKSPQFIDPYQYPGSKSIGCGNLILIVLIILTGLFSGIL